MKPLGHSRRRTRCAHALDSGGGMLAAGHCPPIPSDQGRRSARTQAKVERGASLVPSRYPAVPGAPRGSHPGGSGAAPLRRVGSHSPGPPYSPGLLLTGLFLPLQKRTLLKTPRTCLSHRERPSLLGLERRLEADTRSLLDSLACRFCRISELAIAAAIAAHGPPAPLRSGVRRPGALGPSRRRAPRGPGQPA